MKLEPLTKRCRIERRSSTTSSTFGTLGDTWELVADAWCSVQDSLPSRTDTSAEGRDVTRRPARVRLAYRTDIDSSMRLVIMRPARTVYNIVGGPAEIGNKRRIELMCEVVE